ncbi:MAG: alpha/beta fold hydrolase [Methylobacteriaceae bacterium]|nr:alpha/beta fold hydrolase [Methylobacteriaceae bacterium]
MIVPSRQRMVPVTFNDFAGWLHPAAGKHGVLLCGPLNHEILPFYQSWHVLAAMIADAGLPSLRFDYHGTGDSLGHDREPRRVDAWLGSVRAAARFMRNELGMETLDLVGMRLGATLGALVAPEIGIDRLVAIAPVVSGRTYIRESQARSKMLAGMWRLGAEARGDIANDGFVIMGETAAAITRLDLTAVTDKPAGETLIIAERPASLEKLAKSFAAFGCSVERMDFQGFGNSQDSATLAKIPLEDWRAIASYLVKGREAASCAPIPPKSAVLRAQAFCEERLIFGKEDRLAGVLCRPHAGKPAATVLFLNTGGNPHLGWGRMSVEHARALAASGIASLRMDIAGLGDAVTLQGSPRIALYREESVADIREALDLLEARGLANVTIIGHCSGAWLALNSALADVRIRGLFLVNLQRFIWTGKENLEALMAQAYRATDSYLQEIGSGAIWQRLRKRDINWPRLPGIARAVVRRGVAQLGTRIWPVFAPLLGVDTESARISAMMRQLSARGTGTLLVYSDTDPGREELARHFGPSGRRLRLPGIRIATIANADHDITSDEARRDYFVLLSDHLACEPHPRADVISYRPAAIAEAA